MPVWPDETQCLFLMFDLLRVNYVASMCENRSMPNPVTFKAEHHGKWIKKPSSDFALSHHRVS